jgi:competence protein ComEA
LIDLNRQEAAAVLFLSGALLLGTMVAVVDHFNADRFEDFSSHRRRRRRARRAGDPGAADRTASINQAGVDRLQSLPQIGPKTAAAIVEYRQAHGPFATVDDLRRVRGIGAATVKRLRTLVSTD